MRVVKGGRVVVPFVCWGKSVVTARPTDCRLHTGSSSVGGAREDGPEGKLGWKRKAKGGGEGMCYRVVISTGRERGPNLRAKGTHLYTVAGEGTLLTHFRVCPHFVQVALRPKAALTLAPVSSSTYSGWEFSCEL